MAEQSPRETRSLGRATTPGAAAPGSVSWPSGQALAWDERWVQGHPAAQELLSQFGAHEPTIFYHDPYPAGLLLAQDMQSYIMRVGALLGTQTITAEQAAALVRGLGCTLLNPDEGAAVPRHG